MLFEKQTPDAYCGLMYTRCDDTKTPFPFPDAVPPALGWDAVARGDAIPSHPCA